MKRGAILMLVATLLCAACAGRGADSLAPLAADSLSRRLPLECYADADSAALRARWLLDASRRGSVRHAAACNALGFAHFLRMDYDGAAAHFARAQRGSRHYIELLAADVGMMRICARTSQNTRFFDCRSRALKRLDRLYEEGAALSDEERRRLLLAESAFRLASALYFFHTVQSPLQAAEELACLPPDEQLRSDTLLWLSALLVRGSGAGIEEQDYDERLLRRFTLLNNCLQLADEGGLRWFSAAATLQLARLLTEPDAVELLSRRRPNALSRLWGSDSLPVDAGALPRRLAALALQRFARFGDGYGCIEARAALAAALNREEEYAAALAQVDSALALLNDYRAATAGEQGTVDARLALFQPDDSVELRWMAASPATALPECALLLRQEACVAFSGVGDKAASDYNRNICLDLLQQVRQNREYESRAGAIERESRQLSRIFYTLLGGILALVVLLLCVAPLLRRRTRRRVQRLRLLLLAAGEILRSATCADGAGEEAGEADDSADDEADGDCDTPLPQRPALAATPFVSRLLGCDGVALRLLPPHVTDAARGTLFPINSPGGDRCIARLLLLSPRPLTRTEAEQIALLLPYFSVAVEQGSAFARLGEELRSAEKEHYIGRMHETQSKCDNLRRKACLSIVTGMKPYIDRIAGEVQRLSAAPAADAALRRRRLEYIGELAAKIDEYNQILALWIKMRHGGLSLQIENFALAPLFATLQKSRSTFELRRIAFTVEPTDLVVKADKALTLFMMNTLVDNARKFTPAGGSVTLSAAARDGYVEVSVSDTGCGLSPADVERILGEKVYDARLIGNGAADAQKGQGFGLMNCKGIIEKYRKSDPLFRVCRFGIESEPGRGSRFFFRLPAGVARRASTLFTALLLCLPLAAGAALPAEPLARFSACADSVYYSNVRGDYPSALRYADSLFVALNRYYRQSGGPLDTLSLVGRGTPADVEWWRSGFATDSLVEEVYFNLLDVRNEAAVAALALGLQQQYRYNNSAYVALYRLVHEDASLADYCDRTQRAAAGKQVAVLLAALLLLLIVPLFYLFGFRRRRLFVTRLYQLLDANRRLAQQPLSRPGDSQEPADTLAALARHLYRTLAELLPLRSVTLQVALPQRRQPLAATFPAAALPGADALCHTLPLALCGGAAGTLSLALHSHPAQGDSMAVRRVADYVAALLNGAVVMPDEHSRRVEQLQDEMRRIRHQANRLHVQNLVLDNCLSMIKHETLYYPGRIAQSVERLLQSDLAAPSAAEPLRDIEELTAYYSEIFDTLTRCAARQLDEVTFRRAAVPLAALGDEAVGYARKASRRAGVPLSVECRLSHGCVVGDESLLRFLVQNLVDEALTCTLRGRLLLWSDEAAGGFVRIGLTDTRRTLAPDEAATLFTPDLGRMQRGDGETLRGTEFIVCKQIVREHDDCAGLRGCRIEACNRAGDEGGFTVWFTLPAKNRFLTERQ